MDIETIPIEKLNPYERNPRMNDEAVPLVAESIREFGFLVPIVIDADGVIVAGHTRLKAAQSLGLTEVPCIRASHLTPEQVRAFRLADNRTAEEAMWDVDALFSELEGLDLAMDALGFNEGWLDDLTVDWGEDTEQGTEGVSEPVEEPRAPLPPVEEDEPPTLEEVGTVTQPGDVWILGDHRLMCGDSLKREDVDRLMDGEKAVLCFTDPPYGMHKEGDGVMNDNQSQDDLLEFNLAWLPLAMNALTDVGSCYVWGTDESLMDIYSAFVKPEARKARLTFRALLTWAKKDCPGITSPLMRTYPVIDEKCLFWMKGVQGFQNTTDQYYEGWEPIRQYLLESRLAMGWDVPTMKRIAGHSDLSRDHWTSKSQFSLPSQTVYETLKAEAEKQRREKGLENDAFKLEYRQLKDMWDGCKAGASVIRFEFYSTRAFFDNTHDSMTTVWNFDRVRGEDREECGGHATPKPVALCARAVRSSSREGDLVLDLFGGSGSTLMACQQTGRRCNVMELNPYFCDVIVARWEKFTGLKAERVTP